ncbi:MAG: hypothetical protein VKM17_01105 [Cyanobacteriota bacterium]|nr:hypothetical protein [Cyanobacteriota bacterium]
MITPIMKSLHLHLPRVAILLALLFSFLLSPATARAAVASVPPGILQQFQKELDSLQNQQGVYSVQQARRLADLSRLDTAISGSDERPTVANNSSHSLGVFVRSKRQSADQPATFAVLGPGHETDDDFVTLALYVPANVPLGWPGRQMETVTSPARVLTLLPGEALEVNDPEAGAGYALSLPAFALESESAELGALPGFTQQELDAQPESAPVD